MIIESDFSDAVKAITSDGVLVPLYVELFNHICKGILSYMEMLFQLIHRDINFVAYSLAKNDHGFGFGLSCTTLR